MGAPLTPPSQLDSSEHAYLSRLGERVRGWRLDQGVTRKALALGLMPVVVINKTFGDLTSTLSLDHVTATGKAQVYQYSAADLTKIVPESAVAVTAPASGRTTSTIGFTFPASSIKLFVIPTQ